MGVGSITQAWDVDLDAIAALTRTRGDLITGGASAWQRLAIGANNTFLGSDGTDASWRTVPTGGITDAAVTYAKIQNVGSLSLFGRSTNSTGVGADIAAASDNQVMRRSGTSIGFGSIDLSQSNAVGSSRLALANIAQGSARSVLGVTGNATADRADIQGTADQVLVINGAGTALVFGAIATAGITNGAVTNAKLANMATATFKGRTTAGTGDPEDLTVTQATALLNAVGGDSGSGGTKGLVPAPGAGDAAAGKFLKADGTFAVPSGSGGGLTNTRLAKTAAYTVVNADKGKTIALGGAAFYALTFSAASGYDADFLVLVLNEDTGRAKDVAISGGTTFRLYPGQSAIVLSQNNVWQTLGRGRWKAPSGTVNLYTDFTNGNNANDGLAAGSGNAKKTVQAALDTLCNDVDFTGTSNPTLAIVNMAASTTDTEGVHFSAHAFVGAQGGAAVKIIGGSGSKITTTGTDALAFFGGVLVQISNVELSTVTSGNCLFVDLEGQVYLLSGVTFGACAGSHMAVQNGGRIYLIANYTVSGGATTAHIIGQAGGGVNGSGLTVTVSASIAVGFWVLMATQGGAVMTGFTHSLGGNTVTGKRYEADNLGLISTNGGGANYFPGTVAGSTSGGGQYV